MIASVGPVCAIRGLGGLASDLEIKRFPDLDSVLQHLESVADHFQGCDPDRRRSGSRILNSIYRFLGFSFRPKAGHDPVSEADAEAVSERFASIACLIDSDGRIWAAPQAFGEPVPYFLGKRGSVRAQDPDIEHGLQVLGRRDTPEADDFAAVLGEVEEELAGAPASPEQIVQLRDAIRRAAVCAAELAPLSGAPVLTLDGRLVNGQNLVVDDAPWIAERVEAAGVAILDREFGADVASAFGVPLLSRAVYE